jgi:NAD(P)-dependent dehydrogenase (short-subunit alcohol dehydrogenase family)
MGKLNDQVAIVTGGGSGMGRATAMLLAKEGARVVIADCVSEGAESTVQEIKASGGEALYIKTDMAKSIEVEKLVKHTIETYNRLNILFNNAGVETELVLTHEYSEAGWDRIIDINLKGVFLGMKYAIPEMLKQGKGAIINNASIDGLVGIGKHAAYCASKAGVIGLTKVAALEYGTQNIRVNAICPGIVVTPLLEREVKNRGETMETYRWRQLGCLERIGQPEEIAQMVLFLASDESSYVTGSSLVIDGGFLAG